MKRGAIPECDWALVLFVDAETLVARNHIPFFNFLFTYLFSIKNSLLLDLSFSFIYPVRVHISIQSYGITTACYI